MNEYFYLCSVNLIIKSNIKEIIMRKSNVCNEIQRMYDPLSLKEKKEFRERFLKETELSLPSFYVCLRTDTFRPLERKLFIEMVKEYDNKNK